MTHGVYIECGKKSRDPEVWSHGEVCLFGMLFACSETCARTWAQREAAPGFRPGEPGFRIEIEDDTPTIGTVEIRR